MNESVLIALINAGFGATITVVGNIVGNIVIDIWRSRKNKQPNRDDQTQDENNTTWAIPYIKKSVARIEPMKIIMRAVFVGMTIGIISFLFLFLRFMDPSRESIPPLPPETSVEFVVTMEDGTKVSVPENGTLHVNVGEVIMVETKLTISDGQPYPNKYTSRYFFGHTGRSITGVYTAMVSGKITVTVDILDEKTSEEKVYLFYIDTH